MYLHRLNREVVVAAGKTDDFVLELPAVPGQPGKWFISWAVLVSGGAQSGHEAISQHMLPLPGANYTVDLTAANSEGDVDEVPNGASWRLRFVNGDNNPATVRVQAVAAFLGR